MKFQEKHIAIFALIALSLVVAFGMSTLEAEGASESAVKALQGAKILINAINFGGILMFYLAANIKQKNTKHGAYALYMALSIRAFAYFYILHIAGFDVWLLGKIETPIISEYIAKLMMFANTVILFCERFVHYYSDPADNYAQEVERLTKQANEWERQAKADEDKRMQAEDRLNVMSTLMNANEVKIREYESNMNAAIEESKAIECKLNACSKQVNAYESMKPILESFVNVPFLSGNTWQYIDSDTMKCYPFGRGKDTIQTDKGKKIKKPIK